MAFEIPQGALYLPDVGLTSSDERAASKVVREYDADCRLGQRKDTGEWIVYMTDPSGAPFPVLGFGTRLPHPDEILKKMYQTDVRRHGEKIFKEIMKRQDSNQDANKREHHDATDVMADAMVEGFRKQGYNPYPRVFIPKGVKT